MNRALASALMRHWVRNPLQLFTLLAGLALATGLWSGVQAINAEARASYDAAAVTLGEGQFDQFTRADGRPISQSTFIALRRAGWQVSPVVEGRLNGHRLIGLDPLTAPGGLGPISVSEGVDIAAFLGGGGQVFANQDVQNSLGDIEAEAVLSPDVAPGTALTDVGVAQRLLRREYELDRLIIATEQPLGLPPIAQIAPQLTRQVAQGGADIEGLTDSFHLNLTAFGLLSFAVGIFIVNGAVGLAFEQRRPVIRTLRALGAPLSRVMVLIGLELFILAALAGLLGVGLGYLVAALLLPDVAASLQGLYGASVSGTLQLRANWVLSGVGMAFAGTVLAASAAFFKLARMPLLASGHARAMAVLSARRARWQLMAGGALLALAAILAGSASDLMTGFLFLGALLTGAALLLPWCLDRLLAGGQNLAKSATAQWFWADTRQQLPGLSLALMALLLAMSANIGVSTMVSSFRTTFVAFLEQRLASDLYVRTNGQEQTEAFLAFAEPRVEAILPITSVEDNIEGVPINLFAIRDHATYRDNWDFLQSVAAPWDRLHTEQTVIINEQLFRRADLAIGDQIMLGSVPLTIVGIYGDYGNPKGEAIIREELFFTLHPQAETTQFGLRLPPEEVADFRAELATAIGLPQSAAINQANIKAISLSVFERTFAVTGALNILTLSVAAFAILMSLLTLANMRVPQLAPAWAIGLTRARLGRLELIRAVVLAVGTSLLAVPLGLALAWALLAIVNVAAFGWKLPMYFYPAQYLTLIGFGLFSAALAALWPSYRLSRTPPAELLKVFGNER